MYRKLLGILLMSALSVRADESFRSLKVKDQTYANVTVTSVTATDIYFMHAGGLASAKLKDLDPAMQQHFHYNAAKGKTIEASETQATIEYRNRMAQQKSMPEPKPAAADQATIDRIAAAREQEDFVAPNIPARSVRGGPAPDLVVERWLTDQPSTDGKFVLIDFWATWCPPCRKSIPELNAFQAKFSDRLVVIGISKESEEDVRKMTSPNIDYSVAIDPHGHMAKDLQVAAIPHCILIDPSGIVRYEGNPLYLDEQKVQHFLDKYSK